MISKHLNKYFLNYSIILFVICSYVLYLAFNKKGLEIYYIIVAVISILGFTKYSITKDLGLSFKLFKDRTFFVYQIPVIILSNLILFLILRNSMVSEVQDSNKNPFSLLLLGFFFFSSIRTFGEEFIFRAILLFKDFKRNNLFFWGLNFIQAFLFSLIHYYIADDLTSRIVFTVYVFFLSVYFGWLNRKFNSLIPSWTIHWMNGLQTLIMAIIF